ncbi:MAG: flavin reductase family protein [Anaerolineales bacterium]|nr:flavin reductase family protein [Anaerolineales bacterium]
MEFKLAELPLMAVKKLMTGTIVPRPIAWVSTISAEGQPNLAPFSFFNAVCPQPPTLLFCPEVRITDGEQKDTLYNVRETGEFVVNVVTDELVEAMNATATELPPEVNEFELAGVTAVPSVMVKPPRVAESPVNFECKLTQIVEVGEGKGAGSVVIGEILYMHIRDDILLPDHKIDVRALKPVSKLAGPGYSRLGEIFDLQRGASQIKLE